MTGTLPLFVVGLGSGFHAKDKARALRSQISAMRAQLAAERGDFDFDDVAREIALKMTLDMSLEKSARWIFACS